MSAEPGRQRAYDRVRFRPMTLNDVEAVLAVEQASYPFPWSEGIFRDCIRAGYFCRIVECTGEITGHAIMSHGAGEAHILNICLRADMRGLGVGRQLMEFLLERARAVHMEDVFLEVRPSNPIAIHLYESLGFVRIGVRKGYYQASGGREDAWIYKLVLEPR
ncbi:ribosomal-protein-alanine N-acetyltransferase [Steroidobacter denitrificans]|uniref:[Ribosomal protein bS18]-alanine N-acetyltransferase n=1 Tax=Steroidobacter denitrificans TaxID=465721 RepID=A0A127F9T2_STEDE|nr:ribosomal protein S18-alanine N-acetyltransferase [Steroidobacter denitrificans]AMN46319.1 ribosomal-protein-alanine N-acetyltransferase [Steroidobacter denitrificans]